jgi:2-methylcitrate dehydratase
MVSQIMTKCFPAEMCSMGALMAIIKLVNEHNILPEQVESIKIQVSTRGAEHIGDPAKRYPQNKETADHSLYYLAAIAIVDRGVSIDSYTDDKLKNPRIRTLIDKVTVEANPELNQSFMGGIVPINKANGQEHSCRVDYPKDHYRNPMTDEEIGEKFRSVASEVVTNKQIREVTHTVYHLETVSDIGYLMELLCFNRQKVGNLDRQKIS